MEQKVGLVWQQMVALIHSSIRTETVTECTKTILCACIKCEPTDGFKYSGKVFTKARRKRSEQAKDIYPKRQVGRPRKVNRATT